MATVNFDLILPVIDAKSIAATPGGIDLVNAAAADSADVLSTVMTDGDAVNIKRKRRRDKSYVTDKISIVLCCMTTRDRNENFGQHFLDAAFNAQDRHVEYWDFEDVWCELMMSDAFDEECFVAQSKSGEASFVLFKAFKKLFRGLVKEARTSFQDIMIFIEVSPLIDDFVSLLLHKFAKNTILIYEDRGCFKKPGMRLTSRELWTRQLISVAEKVGNVTMVNSYCPSDNVDVEELYKEIFPQMSQ